MITHVLIMLFLRSIMRTCLLSILLSIVVTVVSSQSINPFEKPMRLLKMPGAEDTSSLVSSMVETLHSVLTPIVPPDSVQEKEELDTFSANLESFDLDNSIEEDERLLPRAESQDTLFVETVSDTIADLSTNPFDIRMETEQEAVLPSPVVQVSKAPVGRMTVMLGCFGLFLMMSIGIGLNRSKFKSMVSSLINTNQLKVIFKSRSTLFDLQFFILYSLFFLSFSFIIRYGLEEGLIKYALDWSWVKILGVLLAIYLVRHGVLWLVDSTFNLQNEVRLFNYSIALHNGVYGTFLVPFVLICLFGPEGLKSSVYYAAIYFGLSIYVMRQIKGGLMALSIRGFSVIYFFIYLCAVEITPILVAWRLLFPKG